VLEKGLGTHDSEATDRKLEALYPATGDLAAWKARGRADRLGVTSTRGDRRLSRARDSREAVRIGFMRFDDEDAHHTKPCVHGARGTGRRATTG
jgi:hypothetical protein